MDFWDNIQKENIEFLESQVSILYSLEYNIKRNYVICDKCDDLLKRETYLDPFDEDNAIRHGWVIVNWKYNEINIYCSKCKEAEEFKLKRRDWRDQKNWKRVRGIWPPEEDVKIWFLEEEVEHRNRDFDNELITEMQRQTIEAGNRFNKENGHYSNGRFIAPNPNKFKLHEESEVDVKDKPNESECSTHKITEKDMEDNIIKNWAYYFPTMKYIANQVDTDVGIIDILAKKNDSHVVIEIKNGHSGDKVVGQIARYITWVKEEYKTDVSGIIIGASLDKKLEYSARALGVTLIPYKDVAD